MKTEKLLEALEATRRHLNNAISAINKDEEAFREDIWHAAAELEYVLFGFSLMLTEQDKPKGGHKLDRTDVGELLVEAADLVEKAVQALKVEAISEAYRNAYTARNHVFKIQKEIDKKKRKVSKV
ncbi:hypothetical protein H5T51_07900 [Candidatus Bathyarchaeota archaeon]|nr:hypothetical protein [Candidatus Bathyarchaeota archaeon]